jgi:hypothetical protein
MTEPRNPSDSVFGRWRERRRAKRQQSLEREYHAQERLSPTTAAYTDADNHARRASSSPGGNSGM